MTGLDVDHDVIVEIACIVTDSNLVALDDGIQLVVHHDAEALAAMDDFVRTMHTKSGLLDRDRAIATIDTAAAAEGSARLRTSSTSPGRASAPLCGNSIGMDRRFLAKYMPELDNYLHYRSIDVSSFKELCRRWYPAIYRKRPGKAEHHRALDDIRSRSRSSATTAPSCSPSRARSPARSRSRSRPPRSKRSPSRPRRSRPSRSKPWRSRPTRRRRLSRATRVARRAASSPTARGAEWPIRPMRQPLPARSPRPPPTSMSKRVRQLGRAPWRRRHRRAARPT